MATPKTGNTRDNEQNKFVDDDGNNVAVNVTAKEAIPTTETNPYDGVITELNLANESSLSTDITRTPVNQPVGDPKNAVDVNIAKSVTITTVESHDGVCTQVNGTATTTFQAIPTFNSQSLFSFLIKNTNASNVDLKVSIDTFSYFTLERGEALSVDMKANKLTVRVKTDSGTCDFESIFFKDTP